MNKQVKIPYGYHKYRNFEEMKKFMEYDPIELVVYHGIPVLIISGVKGWLVVYYNSERTK